jgi:hypothetical protein
VQIEVSKKKRAIGVMSSMHEVVQRSIQHCRTEGEKQAGVPGLFLDVVRSSYQIGRKRDLKIVYFLSLLKVTLASSCDLASFLQATYISRSSASEKPACKQCGATRAVFETSVTHMVTCHVF